MEQAVLQVGALDLDMVGQLEAPLERAGRDAAVQELASLVLGLLLAADVESLLLDVDLQLILAEARHRHGNAVLVLAEPLDVVGRVDVGLRLEAGPGAQQIEQAVKADGGAIERGKIDVSHHKSSYQKRPAFLSAQRAGQHFHAHPRGACAGSYLGGRFRSSRA